MIPAADTAGEIRNNHRQRPDRERHEESTTYDVPVTAHPVLIFYDLTEEATGWRLRYAGGASRGTVPSERLLVD